MFFCYWGFWGNTDFFAWAPWPKCCANALPVIICRDVVLSRTGHSCPYDKFPVTVICCCINTLMKDSNIFITDTVQLLNFYHCHDGPKAMG